jgi:acyl-coenzyme A synthetase/AMP-(fatty) acid ligase
LNNFFNTFQKNGDNIAVVFDGKEYSYSWLSSKIREIKCQLESKLDIENKVVGFDSDYSPVGIALFFALVELKCIVVPLSVKSEIDLSLFMETAQIQFIIKCTETELSEIIDLHCVVNNSLLLEFISSNKSGLILFSSGTTGIPKATLHNCEVLISQNEDAKNKFNSISFLLMDHIGGIKTILYQLLTGGLLVLTNDKSTSTICNLIQKWRINLLPVTPSFLNLLIISEDYKKYDLSSLQIVTYGTEVMPGTTLRMFNKKLPNVKLKQTYGLTELGILASQSESSESKWVKLGGEGYELKVVDGLLWIKTKFSMVGYLNAPTPFDDEGWFNTNDMVEMRGDYFKILGRNTDIINVGGLKVLPQEIEDFLLSIPEIKDVTVYGEPNALIGNIMVAKVTPSELFVDEKALRTVIVKKCKESLLEYKIPSKIVISNDRLHNNRFKKSRTVKLNEGVIKEDDSLENDFYTG